MEIEKGKEARRKKENKNQRKTGDKPYRKNKEPKTKAQTNNATRLATYFP
jgi:hypothetical protein